jgi:hypothetical protein
VASPPTASRPCEGDGREKDGGFPSDFAGVSSSHGCLAKVSGVKGCTSARETGLLR